MIQVQVKFFGRVRSITKKPLDEVQIANGATIRDLAATLSEKYGNDLREIFFKEDGSIQESIPIFRMSGKPTRDMDTPVIDNSTVVIMPGLAGGSALVRRLLAPPTVMGIRP